MPTYEYECTHCRHRFELFQKISDQPVNNCPECNQKAKRLISSGVGIIFKAAQPPVSCPKAKEGCNGCQPE